MRDTVVILGTANTLSITPWDLEGCDYWACSPVITHPPFKGDKQDDIVPVHRLDALFEMHKSDYWSGIINRLNNFSAAFPDAKIFMQEKYDAIQNSEKYPLTEIQAFLNHPKLRSYFTSTIAYMIALAIYSGYKTIELYGVHMASGEEEYSLQRSCVEALLAFGWGRGVDFYLPEESDIMKSNYLYGYQQENGILLKAIQYKQGVANGEAKLRQQLEKLKEEYWQQKGGVNTMDAFVKELKKRGMG